MSDGPKVGTASIIDSGGNISAPTVVPFTIDTIAPSAPTILGPTSGSLLNTGNLSISGTGEAGASIILILS